MSLVLCEHGEVELVWERAKEGWGKRVSLDLWKKSNLAEVEGWGQRKKRSKKIGELSVWCSVQHLTPCQMNEWRKLCFAWPINFPTILCRIHTAIREFFSGCFPIIAIWRCEKLHSTARKTTPRAFISICASSPCAGKYLDSQLQPLYPGS